MARKFSNGIAKVRIGKLWGLINKEGKELAPIIYKTISDFKDGIAEIEIDDKFGFMNTEGKVIAIYKYTISDTRD